MRRGTVVLVSLACAATLAVYLFTDIIPPRMVTEGTLSTIELRVQLYVAEHGRLPGRLSDLPQLPDHDDKPIDGWGNPITYSRQEDGSVVLASSGGADGSDARSIRFSTIPPGDKADSNAKMFTFNGMGNIERLLRKYVTAHHELPPRLADLPDAGGLEPVDGWGGPLDYQPGQNGSVVLTSHGKMGSNQVFSDAFVIPGAKGE
jgi:hypothetical protein